MLLYLYIRSTAYVWIDTFKSHHDMNKRLKKEGYKFVGNKHFGITEVVLGAVSLAALSIPVGNLIFPLSNLNKEKAYDEYKNYLLDAGAIEKEEKKIKELKKEESIFQSKESIQESIDKIFAKSIRPINPPEDNNDLTNGYSYKKTK